MIRSLLLGALAGQRSLTPLAVVSDAARRGALPEDNGALPLLGHPLVSAGTAALAAAELWGDKLKSAPDRIVKRGLAVRIVTGAVAGMAMAPRDQRVIAAAVGAGAAMAASYFGWSARMAALRRYGQTETGLAEDALVVGGALAAVHAGSPRAA
ncbi:DUF4126 family protein [Sphingomonas aracearum]|uniref:DUF4126 family protein n=1 Tax=Sphingomonas aracearum TaxID=2283317 RepID=A0A369VVS1_9SPHN|nr:DUF4126 family protein [Sphingomonas aracearum]RDE06193.1 DUF4126 family protein [Sphingomonas aracearum]